MRGTPHAWRWVPSSRWSELQLNYLVVSRFLKSPELNYLVVSRMRAGRTEELTQLCFNARKFGRSAAATRVP